jgi:hypothetical protein
VRWGDLHVEGLGKPSANCRAGVCFETKPNLTRFNILVTMTAKRGDEMGVEVTVEMTVEMGGCVC